MILQHLGNLCDFYQLLPLCYIRSLQKQRSSITLSFSYLLSYHTHEQQHISNTFSIWYFRNTTCSAFCIEDMWIYVFLYIENLINTIIFILLLEYLCYWPIIILPNMMSFSCVWIRFHYLFSSHLAWNSENCVIHMENIRCGSLLYSSRQYRFVNSVLL